MTSCVLAAAALCQLLPREAVSDTTGWSQFRGPGGSGVAAEAAPPVALGTDNVAWSVAIAPGHSSPVLAGDRIFLTAIDDGQLVTLAINARDGKQVWRKPCPPAALEKVHQAGSPAASTPCTDGDRVYVYFGSYGLICYDHDGNEIWKKPISTPKTLYGMSASPVVHGDRLYMVLDNDANMTDGRLSQSRIIALDKTNGKLVWETPRPFHRSGWSTPTIWKHEKGLELVVLGNGQLRGYDAKAGDELWHVNGFSRETISMPIVGDGVVYASASMIGGVADDRPDPEPYWKAVMHFDANKDGKLQRSEMTGHFTFPFRPDLPPGHPGFGMPLPSDKTQRDRRLDGMFAGIDKNKDGFWSRDEFVGTMNFNRGKPNLIAVRPGGRGDVSESHVAWALHRHIPEVPSPVLYRDRLYLVRDGGVLTSVDAKSGDVIYQSRLDAGGHYRSSPIVAGGHLYLLSERGIISIVKTGEPFELVQQYDLKDSTAATPALDATSLYVRTASRLIAFRRN